MTYVPLLVCSIYVRGCQIDDTGHQPFLRWPQFCKFVMPTGSIRNIVLLLFKEQVGPSNLQSYSHSGIPNRQFETP